MTAFVVGVGLVAIGASLLLAVLLAAVLVAVRRHGGDDWGP